MLFHPKCAVNEAWVQISFQFLSLDLCQTLQCFLKKNHTNIIYLVKQKQARRC